MNIRNNASLGHAEAISCPPDSDLYAMFVYATAAVNLYGTISIDELCEIVNGYTDANTDPKAAPARSFSHSVTEF